MFASTNCTSDVAVAVVGSSLPKRPCSSEAMPAVKYSPAAWPPLLAFPKDSPRRPSIAIGWSASSWSVPRNNAPVVAL